MITSPQLLSLRSCLIVICIGLLSLVTTFGQSFWGLTYSFPGGPKTGITLAQDSCLLVGLTAGVIRSCDEGYSFDKVLHTPVVFTIFSTRSGMVVVGGAGKIYRTEDLGESWDSVTLGSIYPITQLLEDHDGGLFAISGTLDVELGFVGDGVFYSADQGNTWTKRNQGLGNYLSCERIAIDKNGRLYLAMADEYVTGHSGLFLSDNKGLSWKHIDIHIDGKGIIPGHIKINRTMGLSVSPLDSVYFSLSGVAGNALVEVNLSKHISQVPENSFWNSIKVFDSVSWWLDRPLYNIHFAANGTMFSSTKGSINTGATYFSTDLGRTWKSQDNGLGLDVSGRRNTQYFAEKSNGRLFMVQLLDERIYQTDIDRPTPVKNPNSPLPDLQLFPNPVAKQAEIFLRGTENLTEISISIFDMMGRPLMTQRLESGQYSFEAPLTAGIYWVGMVSGGDKKTLRLVVQ